MAYDEELARRIRDLVTADEAIDGHEVTERKMFGGLAFLVSGNMAVVASGQGGLMARVDPTEGERLIAETPAHPMEMRGRAMTGWLRVSLDDVAHDADLAAWVTRGTSYAASLPAK